jgi:predicted DNA-binding protein (MmcQ/YjbR family)
LARIAQVLPRNFSAAPEDISGEGATTRWRCRNGEKGIRLTLDGVRPRAIFFWIMNIDWVREFCLSLPHTTEKLQWEDALVFKVGGKMYTVVSLEPDETWISFKCSAEEFAALIERPGVVPAPYLARAQWVALETEDALSRDQIRRLLAAAHSLIFAKLPKSTQAKLSAAQARKRRALSSKPRKASKNYSRSADRKRK